MNASSRHARLLLYTFLLYTLGVTLSLYSYVHQSAEATPTSLSAHSQGALALYKLYGAYYPVDRLEAPFTTLTQGDDMLVVLEPLVRNISEPEAAALYRWLTQGGTLLYCASSAETRLPNKLPAVGLLPLLQASSASSLLQPAANAPAWMRNVHLLSSVSTLRFNQHPPAGVRILAQDEYGPVALESKVGSGRIIALTMPDIFSNDGIAKADNALFLYKIASLARTQRRGRLLFDEYHHGLGLTGGSAQFYRSDAVHFWQLCPAPLRSVLLSMLLPLAALIWRGNKRLGPPLHTPNAKVRRTQDYIAGMAALMKKAQAADTAALTLLATLRRSLLQTLQLAPDAPTQSIIAGAQKQMQEDTAELGTLLQLYERIEAGEKFPPQELPSLVSRIDKWQRRCKSVVP